MELLRLFKKPNIKDMKQRKDVEGLIKTLRDKDRSVRLVTVISLGEIRDVRAVEPLLTALMDDDWSVRAGAAIVLGDIGGVRAVEPLLAALRDENSGVRSRAAIALGEIRDVRAVPALEDTTSDSDKRVGNVATEALDKLKSSNAYKKYLKEEASKNAHKEVSASVFSIESELVELESSGMKIQETERLLTKSKQLFDVGDYEEALKYAKQSEDAAKKIKEEYMPEIILDLQKETFQPDTWKKVGITVRNIGSIPANDIEIKPSGDIEFSDIPAISQLDTNETETITIAMKPTAAGGVPIDIVATYKDGLNRDYRLSDEVWMITVAEPTKASPQSKPELAKPLAAIEIKRGYEVLPNNDLRFGIRVINLSDYAILDVETILDYPRTLFSLKGDVVQTLANIHPNGERTAKYVLTPRGCVHNEKIDATIIYRDHTGKRRTEQMRGKEVHCVCPFLREKALTEGEFAELAAESGQIEEGLSFSGIAVYEAAAFIKESCTHRLHTVGEHEIDNTIVLNLAGESIGEKACYLLTAVVQPYKEKDVTRIALRAYSDKPHGLHGFLNEIVGSIRHLVGSVQSAKEIGIIEEKQVINIIDSVVQRTSFGGVGQGTNTEVNIKDSVVHRSDVGGGDRDSREVMGQKREL